MKRSKTVGQLAAALSASQLEMRTAAAKSQNPRPRGRYADVDSVLEAVQPLARNGIAITQSPSIYMEGDWGGVFVCLETSLIHISGEWVSDVMMVPLPAPRRGVSQIKQIGEIIAHLRRYTISAMAGSSF